MARYTESDQGKQRDRNEDHVYSFKLDDVYGLVVADGLGGHNAGHIASETAARAFGESFQQLNSDDLDEEAVRLSFEDAETAVHRKMEENPDEYEGMGSTLVTAVIKDGKALVGNAGDSRAYLIRGDEIRQITEDHVEKQHHGMAGHLRKSTYLYNVVGGRDNEIEVDVFDLELSQDDVLLLCTDGLTDELSDSRIQKVVSKASSVSDAGRNLVKYANRSGGSDNITVALYSPN
jgi:protein phosphatase